MSGLGVSGKVDTVNCPWDEASNVLICHIASAQVMLEISQEQKGKFCLLPSLFCIFCMLKRKTHATKSAHSFDRK